MQPSSAGRISRNSSKGLNRQPMTEKKGGGERKKKNPSVGLNPQMLTLFTQCSHCIFLTNQTTDIQTYRAAQSQLTTEQSISTE